MEKNKTQADDTSDYYGSIGVLYNLIKRRRLVMVEGHMYHAAMDFIREIKESQEFLEYKAVLARLKEEPDLYEKANEFRQKSYALQNMESGEDYIERLEKLEKEFEDVWAIPLVEDFLEAELCFCRMMQEINEMIWEEIDFQ